MLTFLRILMNWFQLLVHGTQSLAGWKQRGAAFVSGAVSALAFAPLYFWPLLFLTFPLLLWLIDGALMRSRSWRPAFWAAWWFGFGYFLLGLHWVGYAFIVDADRHAWLLPFVALLFPGGLALFFGGAAALAGCRWTNGAHRAVLLAGSLSAFEWLRGHVLTGLPWNLPGYVWAGSAEMIQSASLYGIYGLSLVTLLCVLLPAGVYNADGTVSSQRRWVLVSPLLLLGLYGFGWQRLPEGPAPVMEQLSLRLVQPDVPQSEKWRPELMERNWKLLVDLTRSPGLESRNVVIWPEAAPPFFMLSTDGALDAAGTLLPDNTVLLTGTQRVVPGSPNRYFNSFAAISGTGQVLGIYDKAHLVPFGEYLPFFRLLGALGISQLTGSNGGFSAGAGVRTLDIPGVPKFGPLICYEAIFPAEVLQSGARPRWLVNVTDDSWFGPWAGPHQHLGIAQVRAVEEGLSIARAANTGVSAIIDPYGRITARLDLNRSGVVDGSIAKPLESTLYSFAGDGIFAMMMLALVGVVLIFSCATPLRQLTVTTM